MTDKEHPSNGKVVRVTMLHFDGTPAFDVSIVNATVEDVLTSPTIGLALAQRYPDYCLSVYHVKQAHIGSLIPLRRGLR